ncbi:hypothetical protein SH661x_001062 [Planctomicrobium sp. SH661]|uniref:hypothetical protein n=1 Tax=Planctomicrobium sp. SH661 TaxID=3448124 RepID=UPI003F5CBB44
MESFFSQLEGVRFLMCSCCPRIHQPKPVATLFKLTLDGGLVWHARKTGYPALEHSHLQPSRAVLTGADDWCADCGGWISSTDPVTQFSTYTDNGGSFDLESDSTTPTTSPRQLEYRHWCLSKDVSTGNRYIWALPMGQSTLAYPAVLPAGSTRDLYLCRFKVSDGECDKTQYINYATNSESPGGSRINGIVADGVLTSRRSISGNSYGGCTYASWGSMSTYANVTDVQRSCSIRCHNSAGTLLTGRFCYYPLPWLGIPFVRHGSGEVAFLKLGASNGTGDSQFGYVSIEIAANGPATTRAVRALSTVATGTASSGSPGLYRADTIDSNGTTLATRMPAQRKLFLLDNNLNITWSYVDPSTTYWSVHHLIVAGTSAVYQFAEISGVWHAVKYTSSGVAWATPFSSVGEWGSNYIYEAREHDGRLYISGDLPSLTDGLRMHMTAMDVSTGNVLWQRQLIDPLSTAATTFGAAEFEIVDDHLLVACNGKVKFE